MGRFLYSLLSFIIALFFLLLGMMCMMLPWSLPARTAVAILILDYSTAIALFGLGFIVIGLSIVLYITFNARHTYYQLRSGPRSVKVDERIIQEYLDTYWKQLFPHADIPHRFTLRNNKLHVIADLPFMPQQDQKVLLKRASDELAEILEKFLGYRQPLRLSLSFQSESRS